MKKNKKKLIIYPLFLAFSLFALNGTEFFNIKAHALTSEMHFNRIATFPVCKQINSSCDTNDETVAEIVSVSKDGNILVYTDSAKKQIGFVDITNPSDPKAAGVVAMNGEPTSVYVHNNYALTVVNTSESYANPSGFLKVVDMSTKKIVREISLGGQPDSIAVSPDGRYAAIVIENERDENLNKGEIPQLPAGKLVIVDINGAPSNWTTRDVSLSGISSVAPTDPEPEYVDINDDDIAVVTLQENNHIALINLVDGSIIKHFSAGSVNLSNVDNKSEKPALISLSNSISGISREPDGATWINNEYFATANEGDLNGGSRGFSIFDKNGNVIYDSGNELEHIAARLGHYPDDRSSKKGNEPEGVEFGNYGGDKYLFVASERSSLIFVYDVSNPKKPVYKQTLPTAAAPEGILAIPSRNLFVAASEKDSRENNMRSSIVIYQYSCAGPTYPTIMSENDQSQLPIPWSALSGLAADPNNNNILYSIEDSYYGKNRIFKIDISQNPARIIEAIRITDANNVLASFPTKDSGDDNLVFSSKDLAAMINADKTVNIDPEGIAVASGGGFWIASEGSGTMNDSAYPIKSLNFLIKTDASGVITQVLTLPDDLNAKQVRFGFEGVAEFNGNVYLPIQRSWDADKTKTRIAVYNIDNKTWSYFYYPLDSVVSQYGGWVGLSDISSAGDGKFIIVERDNRAGLDAAIKRLYSIDVLGKKNGDTLTKTLIRDLMPDLRRTNGAILEKIEGAAILKNGNVYIVNDNDGVKDSNGETQLINIGALNLSPVITGIIICDINGDKKGDIIYNKSDGAILYSTDLGPFMATQSNVIKELSCGDLNGDSKSDIIGADYDGYIYYSVDGGNKWSKISKSLKNIAAADFNGDGNADIAGVDALGNIWVTYDLSSWTKAPGILSQIKYGNFNSSRLGFELAGINDNGNAYFSNDLLSWENVPGSLAMLSTGDLNNDGIYDLIGINSGNQIYYSTNLKSWKHLPGSLSYVALADLNGDKKDDIIGRNSDNAIFYSFDMNTWKNLTLKLSIFATGDINGDGKADVVGLGMDNIIYYTTDLSNWKKIN